MKKYSLIVVILLCFLISPLKAQSFQGKATYISKSKMELGNWGAKLSEARKNQIKARLKNRLEKTYFLTFNTQESFFKEDEKIDAISGATDSWGAYFSRGNQYKNVKESKLIQSQEFYGKRFLVKDSLYKINWTMGTESKKIGNYTCYKAKAFVPKQELNWYNFSWSDLRKVEKKEGEAEKPEEAMIVVEAWYSPQIPVSQGPAEFWGLPGLILEVSYNNTTLLCTEVVINKDREEEITIPTKGEEITKSAYTETIRKRMQNFRNNRGGRRSR
jgi:GLPGLI family protein